MKKNRCLLFLCLLSFALSGCAKQPVNAQISEIEVLDKLKSYLPYVIFENLPDYKSETLDDGSSLYYWGQSKGNETIHKIEYIFDANGIIQYYYKNYSFELPKKQISIKEAEWLVHQFAQDFFTEGEALTFEHKGDTNSSLYDPGVIEGWQAKSGSKEFVVMIDMLHRLVVYSSVN